MNRTAFSRAVFLGGAILLIVGPLIAVALFASGRVVVVTASQVAGSTEVSEIRQVDERDLDEALHLTAERRDVWVKTLASGALSLLVGGLSCYILISKNFPEQASRWAQGTLTFILGFWMG